jgi:hypothetical protein
MAQFRWAYINCSEEDSVSASGATGSLQFLSGAGVLTGSSNLIFNTSSNTLLRVLYWFPEQLVLVLLL